VSAGFNYMSTYTRFTSPKDLTFWRSHLPYSSTVVSSYPTLFGSFGSGLSASNFSFNNVVDAVDCVGDIVVSNVPLGRFHLQWMVYRTSATSFGASPTYALNSVTNVYFNRDYNSPNYLLDEVTYISSLGPEGPEPLNSINSTERTLVIDFYFTTTSTTNSFTLRITKPGAFPSLDVASQNGLFTCVCVGPSTVQNAGDLNFVDDLNYEPG